MASQESIIKLKGQVGDLTFYRTKDGYVARKKGGIDPNRLKTDPAFERTRENGAEFGKAGTASKVLRTALRTYLINVKDSKMTNRLTREMIKVIQADSTSLRGQRNVINGDLTLLTGFEFNENGKLASSFFAPFTPLIDRVTGNLSVDVPAFIPGNMVAKPDGATHLKLVMVGAEVDFKTGGSNIVSSESVVIPFGPQEQPALVLNGALAPQSTNPLFLVFGMQFSQFVNGAQYPLRNGAFNSLEIVSISKP